MSPCYPDLRTFYQSFYSEFVYQSHQTTPFSEQYQDFYYMKSCGLAERRFLYLEDQLLFERLTQPNVTLGEIGFGTGLSFLSALTLWKKQEKHLRQSLLFISFEKNPLSKQQLKKALEYWRADLGCVIDELLERWVGLLPGVNHLVWLEEKVCLTLIIGDAYSELKKSDFQSNHWLLDGFSPSKNPDAWSFELLKEVSRCTAHGGTLSSFTGSQKIKERLESCGWSIQKTSGFGGKKYRITGSYSSPRPPAELMPTQEFTVLGAGISGLSICFWRNFFHGRSLCIDVSGPTASMAPHIYLHPALHQKLDPFTVLSIKSHVFAGSIYRQMNQFSSFNYQSGSFHLKNHELRIEKIWHNLAQESLWQDMIQETDDRFLFPLSGRFHGALCLHTLKNASIFTEYETYPHSEKIPKENVAIASSWAASPNIAPFTMLRGEISLKPDGFYTPSTYDRYCFRAAPSHLSQESFVGFRTHTTGYQPISGQIQPGIFASLFHGTRGFSSAMLIGLEIALESMRLFSYHSKSEPIPSSNTLKSESVQ